MMVYREILLESYRYVINAWYNCNYYCYFTTLQNFDNLKFSIYLITSKKEICMNRRMQPPVYEVSLEEGLPHERNFVINCLVGTKFRESGCGKSKKLAKRKAAAKMLATLKAQPIIVDDCDHIGGFSGIGGKCLPIDEDELALGIAQRNAMLKGQKNKGIWIMSF